MTPFISPEEIQATRDIRTLKEHMQNLEDQAGKMEADLEFRTDADEDWERRACAALGLAKTRIKQIGRRIFELENGEKFKSGRSLIAEQNQRALIKVKTAAENSRIAADNSRRRLAQQAMRMIVNTTLNCCIVDVLRERFSDDEWDEILSQARSRQEQNVIDSIEALAAE